MKPRGALVINTLSAAQNYTSAEACVDLLNFEEICKVEPFISLWSESEKPATAVHQPEASSGNSELFTHNLANRLQSNVSLGVKFRYGVNVKGFKTDGARILGIETADNSVISTKDADVVIACGSYTPQLLWKLKLFTPIYPLKGYVCRINDR